MRESVKNYVRESVTIPAHVRIAAGACAADLMHGPRFAREPKDGWEKLTEDDVSPIASDLDGKVTQVYQGPVGDLLRDFIAELPTLYIDEDDCIHTSEPESYELDGEMMDPASYCELASTSVVEALFGTTIAHEFR